MRIGKLTESPVEIAAFDIAPRDGAPCPEGEAPVWTLAATVDDAAEHRVAVALRQESVCRS